MSSQYGTTPLHEAAIKGHTDIAKALVEAGADVNAKDMVSAPTMPPRVRDEHKEG